MSAQTTAMSFRLSGGFPVESDPSVTVIPQYRFPSLAAIYTTEPKTWLLLQRA